MVARLIVAWWSVARRFVVLRRAKTNQEERKRSDRSAEATKQFWRFSFPESNNRTGGTAWRRLRRCQGCWETGGTNYSPERDCASELAKVTPTRVSNPPISAMTITGGLRRVGFINWRARLNVL